MDIKEILDPRARHVFFALDDLNYAYPIVHVENDSLYFTADTEIENPNFDKGHFLAPQNAGIVLFAKPIIKKLPTRPDAQGGLQKVYRMMLSSEDYEITNRRQHTRHEFKNFIPMNFSIFGETISAQLINISEGGLKMCVDTPLKKNILCRLEINLPRLSQDEDPVLFTTNGLIVYSENETTSGKYFVGINFITPDFVSIDQKQDYLNAKKTLAKFIERHIQHDAKLGDADVEDTVILPKSKL